MQGDNEHVADLAIGFQPPPAPDLGEVSPTWDPSSGHRAQPPGSGDLDRTRAQRWAGRLVTVIALASVAPLVYLVAQRRRDGVLSWLDGLADNFLDPVAFEDPRSSAVGLVAIVVIVVGVGGFLLLAALRRWVSARVVRRAVARGQWQPRGSLTLVLTVAAWALLFAAVTIVATVQQAISGPNTSDFAQYFIDQPAWLALTIVGFAVGWSHWSHRRRHEVAPLVAAGLVATVSGRGRESFVSNHDEGGLSLRQGLRAFVWVLVISGAFGVVGWIELLLADSPTPLGSYVGQWLTMTLLFPGLYVMCWLVLLALLPRTRWMVRRVLREPWVLLSLVLAIGGYLVALVAGGFSSGLSGAPGPVATVGLVAALVGTLVATVTSLGVQDVGPQPWLGLLFLVLLWVSGFQDVDAGSFDLPGSAPGWIVAVLVTAFAVHEGVVLWREHLGTASAPRGL